MTNQIQHDRPGCIACGACAAVAPDFWDMDPNDGKSNLKNCKKVGDQEHRDLLDDEFETNKEAAECCPVNVIHIINKETGDKII